MTAQPKSHTSARSTAPAGRRRGAPVARPGRGLHRGPASPRSRPPLHRDATGAPAVARWDRPARIDDVGPLVLYIAATLVVVIAVVIAAAVDRWWILIPVMAVDFIATYSVLRTINRLLRDDGEPPPA